MVINIRPATITTCFSRPYNAAVLKYSVGSAKYTQWSCGDSGGGRKGWSLYSVFSFFYPTPPPAYLVSFTPTGRRSAITAVRSLVRSSVTGWSPLASGKSTTRKNICQIGENFIVRIEGAAREAFSDGTNVLRSSRIFYSGVPLQFLIHQHDNSTRKISRILYR